MVVRGRWQCRNGENGDEENISWPCTHDSYACGYEMGVVEMNGMSQKWVLVREVGMMMMGIGG